MVNLKKALATVMVASLAFPSVAFAATNEPSTSGRDTDGTTDLSVVLASSGEANASDENITFTVPTSINFVMKADGTLVAPSPSAIYIENESAFSISAPGFSYESSDGWNLGSYLDDVYFEEPSNVSFGSDGVANTYSLGVSVYTGEDNYLTSSDILSIYDKANDVVDIYNAAVKNGEDANSVVSSKADEFFAMLNEVYDKADEVCLHDTSKSYGFSFYKSDGFKREDKTKAFQYDVGSVSNGGALTTLGEKTVMLPNIVHNTKGIGLEDNKANFSFIGLAANVTKDISSSDKLGTITWSVEPIGGTDLTYNKK